MHRASRSVTRIRTIVVAAIVILILFAAAYGSYYYASRGTKSGSHPTTTSSIPATIFSSTTNGLANQSVWPTYHMDSFRDGYDPNEPAIGSVHSNWNSTNLDGSVYAEPLVGWRRVFVATENNSIYAFNATTGATLWRTNLGSPVPGNTLPCGDIDPSGITGTPVLDMTHGIIYAVAFLYPHQHVLYGVDVITGVVKFERSVDPSGMDPTIQQERGALALSNGIVYIPYGGLDGDCGSYHGWVVGVETNSTSSPLLTYETPTFSTEAGIWGASGPAASSSGDILVATGNGASTSTYDYGDSVLRLSPNLSLEDSFAPSNWASLNAGDTDVGSAGPMLLGSSIVFQAGKEGVGYLLNEKNLGGTGGQPLFEGKVCGSAYGGTAYYSSYIYVSCSDGLYALKLNASSPSFASAWSSSTYFSGPPIVAGGAVWAIDIYDGILYAYNAQSGSVIYSVQIGSVAMFSTPAAGYGQVFVAANGVLESFALA